MYKAELKANNPHLIIQEIFKKIKYQKFLIALDMNFYIITFHNNDKINLLFFIFLFKFVY